MAKISGILLDIEGTTSSISFVHDVMFPFVAERLEAFLAEQGGRDDVAAACELVAKDAGHESLSAWVTNQSGEHDAMELVVQELRSLMSRDAKATGLKAIQGLIWDGGFRSGQLKAHVFDDVIPCIKAWRAADIDVRIYSSGSIAAQKLFFGHLDIAGQNDCLHLLSGHYDTTIGGKKEAESYRRVVADWGLPAGQILFVSDIAEELQAAQEAGLQVRASVRAGNKPLPEDLGVETIGSFEEITV